MSNESILQPKPSVGSPSILAFRNGERVEAEIPSSPLASTVGYASSDVFPPVHPYRTLVLCFDGTGDQFDSDNSNIVEFFSMLKKDDSDKQMVYYQAGIGTYTIPEIATSMISFIRKNLDMAFANCLDAHIMGGYEFLMQNYKTGDRICIFGFSRGAYTARCLAGMIHKVGLLPSCNHQQVPFAYKMYTNQHPIGWEQSNAFRKAFSVDVDIEFVGVWDTVNSVGLIPRRLPFTTSNTIINTFRHAISLDEHRSKFQPNCWNRAHDAEKNLSIVDQFRHKAVTNSPLSDVHHNKMTDLEKEYFKDRAAPTDVDEVWFAGCHCDVGGGSVYNGTKPCLSRIPLRWMIRECFKTKTGILFHGDGLRSLALVPAALMADAPPPPLPEISGPLTLEEVPRPKPFWAKLLSFSSSTTESSPTPSSSLPESEAEQEVQDALAPVYDQLQLKWGWWILEIIPLRHRLQKLDNTWLHFWSSNLGRGRKIPNEKESGVRVHRSVKLRMEASYAHGSKYIPHADLDLDSVTWVA